MSTADGASRQLAPTCVPGLLATGSDKGARRHISHHIPLVLLPVLLHCWLLLRHLPGWLLGRQLLVALVATPLLLLLLLLHPRLS